MKCHEILPVWSKLGCYELQTVSPGLPVSFDTDSGDPQVMLGAPDCKSEQTFRVKLSDDLKARLAASRSDKLFSHTAIRLNECHLDERSEFWLDVPEKSTENDVLIMVSFFGDRGKRRIPIVEFSVDGPDARIIASTTIQGQNGRDRYRSGNTVLCHLKPGSCLKAKICVKAVQSRNRGFLKSLTEEYIRPAFRTEYRITAAKDGSVAIRES